MKFIAPIPDRKYYLWQSLVQIANFREMGYEQDLHIPIINRGKLNDLFLAVINNKDLKCHFHVYPDTRTAKNYSASMKPFLMGKYFEQFPDEAVKTYCYLDADCIFTKPMDFAPFEKDDNTWYGSNTAGYTGEKYIKKKGEQLWYDMLKIADLDPVLIDGKKGWEIGAQYFIKNCPSDLWFDIERKSVEGYKFMHETKKKYHPETEKYHIQIWCSEMYYTQYEALRRGIKLQVSDLMQFHWAGHNILEWYHKPFFHDAGQTSKTETGVHFCKQAYNGKSPFKRDIKVEIKSASYKYLELIRRTEQYFPDLVDLFVQHDNGAKVLKPKQEEQININNQILKIVKAEYGNKDVKAIVEKRITDNRIKIKAENALFGDPQPNRKKQLNVVYSLNDKVFNVSVKENDMFVI